VLSKGLHQTSLAKVIFLFDSSTGQIAGIAIVILIVLFAVQRFGTDKVGYTFGPVILTWFILIAGIGIYNLIKHDIGILKAFNPKYIVEYFQRNGKDGWISLGGVVLCITGILISWVHDRTSQ
jgi:KUP system potassium uptake protein